MHQPHHEHVRLATLTTGVDKNFEEVDLRQIAGAIHERHEHLLPSSLPLAHDLFHDRVADVVTLAAKQRVQACCRQPLLSAA